MEDKEWNLVEKKVDKIIDDELESILGSDDLKDCNRTELWSKLDFLRHLGFNNADFVLTFKNRPILLRNDIRGNLSYMLRYIHIFPNYDTVNYFKNNAICFSKLIKDNPEILYLNSDDIEKSGYQYYYRNDELDRNNLVSNLKRLGLEKDNKIKELINFGYSWDVAYQINEVLKKNSIKNDFDSVMEYIMSLGYTKEQVIKMTSEYPRIFNIEKYKVNTPDDMISIGYTREEAISMIVECPYLFSKSASRLLMFRNNIISNEYTEQEKISITVGYPDIFNPNNIFQTKDLIDYYNSIGLHDALLIQPDILKQSINISQARYDYYKSIGLDIDIYNFEELFIKEEEFQNKYNVSSSELIRKYNSKKILSLEPNKEIGNGNSI